MQKDEKSSCNVVEAVYRQLWDAPSREVPELLMP